MIMWNKLDPKTLLVEVLGIDPKEKTAVTIAGAVQEYCKADGIEFPANMKLWAAKVLEHVKGNRLVNTITVKEAKALFETVLDKENEATAYRVRGVLVNAINHALTGRLPEVREPKNGAGALERLKFTAAKLDDVLSLLPIHEKQGRFGSVKSEVHRLINSLPQGQAGVIQAPKKSMDKKEADALKQAIGQMFAKAKQPWTIRYNEAESLFIVIRKTDLEKIKGKGASQ